MKWDLLVHKAHRVSKGFKVLQAQLVLRDHKVKPVLRVKSVLLVHKVNRDLRVSKV